MTELRTDLDDQELMTPRAMAGTCRAATSPIVPKRSIAGRALVAVVAIMTFLASLTTGAVMLVRSAAVDWQSEVAREVTIQVRPDAGPRPRCRGGARGRDRPRRSRRRRGAALFQGGVGAPARAVARQRACARRPAGAAHDRGEACRPARRRSRAAAQGAGRAGRRREPRRSSRLDRPHARHGADRGRRRHRRARS